MYIGNIHKEKFSSVEEDNKAEVGMQNKNEIIIGYSFLMLCFRYLPL